MGAGSSCRQELGVVVGHEALRSAIVKCPQHVHAFVRGRMRRGSGIFLFQAQVFGRGFIRCRVDIQIGFGGTRRPSTCGRQIAVVVITACFGVRAAGRRLRASVLIGFIREPCSFGTLKRKSKMSFLFLASKGNSNTVISQPLNCLVKNYFICLLLLKSSSSDVFVFQSIFFAAVHQTTQTNKNKVSNFIFKCFCMQVTATGSHT